MLLVAQIYTYVDILTFYMYMILDKNSVFSRTLNQIFTRQKFLQIVKVTYMLCKIMSFIKLCA